MKRKSASRNKGNANSLLAKKDKKTQKAIVNLNNDIEKSRMTALLDIAI